jgi:hypothetical protein
MSAVDTALPAGTRELTPSAPRRVWSVVRLHAANPWPTLCLPWLILLAVFAMTYSIWRITAAAVEAPLGGDTFRVGGGILFVFVYMLVAAVQAMNLTFRFALGLSVARRDYYLGTSVYFVFLSLLYGVGLGALGTVERLTDGWGVHGAFFAPPTVVDLEWWRLAYVYVLVMAFFLFVGAAVATLYQRWKSNGIVAFFVGLGVVMVGAAWLITATAKWSDVGAFFVRYQVVGTASWSLVLTALAAVFGFLVLRRATPK